MPNPDQFREPGSGELSCPSGCLSYESCGRTELIKQLAQSSRKLRELTEQSTADDIHQITGSHKTIRTELQVKRNLQSTLESACLLYHLNQTGGLTKH